ncbi:LOW QUALITY PROTEIN: hypothetical protein HID58_079431 [Brassica napus]|uniref:SKP1 component POZ domain-containing protein n=1 Tax=Brassica napus TaxID=3708 RepID=A0ABQ7Y210_BRANA|nr:LOW QUALITY PROTEIN: hypothetical protein HID58_079431 [Brassica napus]
MSTSKIFRVKSSDGEIFEVPEAVAVQSQMISYMNMYKLTLFGLINMANYLNIKNLFDLSCQTIADMITCKLFILFSTLKLILHPKRKRKCASKTSGLYE